MTGTGCRSGPGSTASALTTAVVLPQPAAGPGHRAVQKLTV
jgi:hypothetical protein